MVEIMNKLIELRKKIDSLDEEIFDLLEKRMNLSKEIKDVKKKENISVLDSGREQEILDKIYSRDHFGEEIGDIYKKIMNVSKDLQKR